MRLIMFALLAGFSAVVGVLGWIPSTWVDFFLLVLLGLGNGYIAIILITWMQARAPKEMIEQAGEGDPKMGSVPSH